MTHPHYLAANRSPHIDTIINHLTSTNHLTHKYISPTIDLTDPAARHADEQKHNSIILFSRSFLSNFYPVPVTIKTRTYPSIEHAYQSQKYEAKISIHPDHCNEINEHLARKGQAQSITPNDSTDNIFANKRFTSGNIKDTATHLDKRGYQVPDRGERKLPLMIDLLIQKYQNPLLTQKLLSIGTKYLIEGNTRNDQYRGRSNGSGNNYLGRIIMYIRDTLLIRL